MAETRALYEAIIKDTLVVARPESKAPNLKSLPATDFGPGAADFGLLPFTGRTAELQTLNDLAPSHKLLLIEGEPGIGKTRLAEKFIEAHTAGVVRTLVLVGKARELEHALPYQPVIEALRGLLTRPDWPALQAGLRDTLPMAWRSETIRLLPELATLTTPAGQPVEMPPLTSPACGRG